MWRIVRPVTTSWKLILLFMLLMQHWMRRAEIPHWIFGELLEEDIRKSKHYILKMRFRRALSGMGFCALIAGLGWIFDLYYYAGIIGKTRYRRLICVRKFLLIDGHSILNRAFYGLPDLTNPEGLHTGAVYGFLNILFKVLGEEKPEYLAVAFDRSEPTFSPCEISEYKRYT